MYWKRKESRSAFGGKHETPAETWETHRREELVGEVSVFCQDVGRQVEVLRRKSSRGVNPD